MTKSTRNGALGLSSAAIALVLASIAWACTAVPSCSGSPDSAAMGTRVSINCIGFGPGAPVQIHWDSPEGPVVGGAEIGARDGSFSVLVTPPQNASADVHYLVAIQRSPDGSIAAKASDTLELTGSGSSRVSGSTALSDNWTGFASPQDASRSAGGSLPIREETRSGSFVLGVVLLVTGALFTATIAVSLAMRRARIRRRATEYRLTRF